MKVIIVAATVWIKNDFGGRLYEPFVGLRPIIRFQRHVSDWTKTAWDVEVIGLDIDPQTWSGTTKMKFTTNTSPKKEWLQEGELIELLDAYRVIAVGKIVAVTTD